MIRFWLAAAVLTSPTIAQIPPSGGALAFQPPLSPVVARPITPVRIPVVTGCRPTRMGRARVLPDEREPGYPLLEYLYSGADLS